MPAAVRKLAAVAHEHFCLPRPEADQPRLEGFVAYEDEPSGRSRPVAFVTRCLECGAATYQKES